MKRLEVNVMLPLVVLLALSVLLSGCAGYQFGDVTKKLISARNIYCSPAVSDEQRQAAKSKLSDMGIDTGEESICGITLEVLLDRVVQ